LNAFLIGDGEGGLGVHGGEADDQEKKKNFRRAKPFLILLYAARKYLSG
jgi:hypothetical protein